MREVSTFVASSVASNGVLSWVRNKPYVDLNSSQETWFVAGSTMTFTNSAVEVLFDHGKEEFIVSVHLLKTLLAARAESRHANEETSHLQ